MRSVKAPEIMGGVMMANWGGLGLVCHVLLGGKKRKGNPPPPPRLRRLSLSTLSASTQPTPPTHPHTNLELEEREEAQGDGGAQLRVRLRADVVVEEVGPGVPDEVAHVVPEGEGEAVVGVFVWEGGGGGRRWYVCMFVCMYVCVSVGSVGVSPYLSIYICIPLWLCVPDEGPEAGDDGDGGDGLEHGIEDAVVMRWWGGARGGGKGQGQSVVGGCVHLCMYKVYCAVVRGRAWRCACIWYICCMEALSLFAVDHPAVEEGQPGGHEQHQRRARHEPVINIYTYIYM